MNKLRIGEELKLQLEKGYSIVAISRWAYKLYSDNCRTLDPSLREILESLFSMEDDPQFEYTERELNELADRLIEEGEKEELLTPISSIKDKATEIDKSWLMCPLCMEAWKSESTYGMVRCPGCKKKLHNPRYL